MTYPRLITEKLHLDIPKTDFKTIDEFIMTFPKEPQIVLEKMRKTIKEAAPEAEEVISYQIPAFKYHGFLVYISAYTKQFFYSGGKRG